MIIANGTIEVKEKYPAGIDAETGHPKAGRFSWGTPIPCQYVPISHDKRAVSNGEHYTRASYTVLLEERPLCDLGEQVRLSSMCGHEIGEYSVVSIEWLEAVCQWRVMI